MKKLYRYIAFFLFLVFIVPLNYQSFHTLSHYLEHEHENHNHEHCSLFVDEHNHNVVGEKSDEECPVCEYEFTTYEFKDFKSKLTITSIISIIQSHFIVRNKFGFDGNNIVLRGPPTL